MKKLILTTGMLTLLSAPAYATLQIAFSDGVNTFTCADGQLGCDLSGGANNLLTLNTVVGSFTVFGTLSASTFGTTNTIDLSSFGVVNNGGAEDTLRLILSDTNFVAPASGVEVSGSLTFHNNVGAGLSTLSFYADVANVQGAGAGLVIPGVLLGSASGTAATNPDSFAGTQFSPFVAGGPFSMTEVADIDLIGGGSITGFDQSAVTSVPEPETWAMALIGFIFVGILGTRKRKDTRAIA